jgi:hypothetical protein
MKNFANILQKGLLINYSCKISCMQTNLFAKLAVLLYQCKK